MGKAPLSPVTDVAFNYFVLQLRFCELQLQVLHAVPEVVFSDTRPSEIRSQTKLLYDFHYYCPSRFERETRSRQSSSVCCFSWCSALSDLHDASCNRDTMFLHAIYNALCFKLYGFSLVIC